MSTTLVRVLIAVLLCIGVLAWFYWRDRHFRGQVDKHILRRKPKVEAKMHAEMRSTSVSKTIASNPSNPQD